ncbi:MAG: hypothetical protein AB8G05_01330 [Oligoflexales bacterium]
MKITRVMIPIFLLSLSEVSLCSGSGRRRMPSSSSLAGFIMQTPQEILDEKIEVHKSELRTIVNNLEQEVGYESEMTMISLFNEIGEQSYDNAIGSINEWIEELNGERDLENLQLNNLIVSAVNILKKLRKDVKGWRSR